MALCLPFPPACAKGRHTLSRAGQASHWKSSAGRGPAQGVSPAGSVGAERCPPGTSAPRRGFLTGNSPLDCFPIFLRLPKATKAVGRCPTPCKFFEKNLTKNFYPPTARTCAGCQHRRGRSRRPIARIVPRGHPPLRAITASPCVSTSRTRTSSPAKRFPLANSTGV